ncbi:MAG: carotenoid 1,2-hydratase, partial [Comamonadaceae bacterium]
MNPLSRRAWLLFASALPLTGRALPPRRLQFPRDFGSHSELKT